MAPASEGLPAGLAGAALAGPDGAAWREAFLAVPRAGFVPAHVWVGEGQGPPKPVSRDTDPDRWAEVAGSDVPVLTQFDDGATRWPDTNGRHCTGSVSPPSLVLTLLTALAVEDGNRVLEVGTGTGYTTALLAHRLGPSRVTSVEIDTYLAATARAALAAHGYLVTVARADGAAGHPTRAPYDRVLSTAAVTVGRLPYAWVAQTRPGGRIVAPLRTDYSGGAVLTAFTVHEDGTATGRPLGRVPAMPLRQHRTRRVDTASLPHGDPDARLARTGLKLWRVARTFDARWAIGAQVPDCHWWHEPPRDGGREHALWLLDPVTSSWAHVRYGATPGPQAVWQGGPRDLWDEVEAAYQRWKAEGRPGVDRWSFVVTPDRQTAVLGDPAGS
ncbi:Protein-L-isoaspartate O-methyltransferase [Streptoalloteichus tenebrarius]|uniref:Protein-L-isoaspartate O-methyltransferase n=1 Tax=Streptoalloteichus tenebrarius (strain ATCC 17920 / DSM 40477 / JCM 4838 / CBS 697.72 / NBRC 16177 / NCIMB 11028 / NRRL B-12390 / A12253. 1 / ISP 5477) TaxID=1933 RepID=A0ABT1HMJ6_STRSD|nr:methyltransferase domain-containing protein [Streptoalloteichus tenebrarius]MCP2256743.1 Protein-L-isoaspartate O-methyltransferase [Streptoalloteichus tenebrarius]BFF00354.1 methyltransferase domain-containing protein [Streptoalloteichus tenebrarius]